jgi:uncharacterized protein (DUF488 family)
MMSAMSPDFVVFTIGHSTHTIERFVGLLRQHGVTAVADVRSVPYSRFQPQFNRETLAAALKGRGIAYVFLGKELGARSEDKTCYENGQVQYRRLAKTEAFRSGLERVRLGSGNHRITLMCAEREPLECHRTLLVGHELAASGVPVVHIHDDGRLESHADAMKRLVTLVGLPDHDLFRSQSELIEQACAAQEKRVAYVDVHAAQAADPDEGG